MNDSALLLALHSCTERFGVAVQDPEIDQGRPRVMGFDDGRGLSNSLIGWWFPLPRQPLGFA